MRKELKEKVSIKMANLIQAAIIETLTDVCIFTTASVFDNVVNDELEEVSSTTLGKLKLAAGVVGGAIVMSNLCNVV